MSSIEKEFVSLGWHVINWTYPSKEKLIEEHANDLLRDLAICAKEYPKEPIHFVTHSMGGLVVRAALNHPACPKEAKIGKAVIIAPPNQGSSFGRKIGKWPVVKKVIGKYAGRQLTTQSDFEHLGQFPKTMDVLVIAGTFGWKGEQDGKVSIEETRLTTPHSHETVFARHSWICHCKKTIELTKSFLLK